MHPQRRAVVVNSASCMDGWDTMCELLEMFFPGQAQDPVHRTCLGKCEIWSDTASNVDSIRVSLYGKPREF